MFVGLGGGGRLRVGGVCCVCGEGVCGVCVVCGWYGYAGVLDRGDRRQRTMCITDSA